MEVVLRLIFLLLAVTVIYGEDQTVGPAQSFPSLRTRSDIRQKRQAGFKRPVGSSNAITPYNQRLDASEWLERLLGSLVAEEPAYGGSSDARIPTPEGQRIFQREVRPSQFAQPVAKKRFSLANIRVDPNSLKRQFVYPTPNMALIQLESPVRVQNPSDFPENYGGSTPLRPSIPNERKPQRQQAGGFVRPSSGESHQNNQPNYSGIGNVAEGIPAPPPRRSNAVDVDVYVKYFN